MRLRLSFAALCTLFVSDARAQLTPLRSYDRLVTSNGFAVASYNRATRRIDTFLERPYRFRTPRDAPQNLCFSADESRDLAFDAYFGLRLGAPGGAGARGEWLGDVPLTDAGYLPGTGIIGADQFVTASGGGGLRVRTYYFMPMALSAPVLVSIARVDNLGTVPLDASVYALFNFHLGVAAGGAREPSADAEEVSYDALRQTFYEYGPSQGTLAYTALSPLGKRTASTGQNGVYEKLRAAADLDDSNATSGPTSDVSPGFQSPAATLPPGASMWFATGITWALDEDAAPAVDRLRTWAGARTPEELLLAERASWTAWHTPAPAGLGAAQQSIWQQQNALLRMSQVREEGLGFGQILASLPPGLGNVDAQWNITWVRDMAYATAALARAGHLAEAKDALAFQLAAGPGRHTSEVGRGYRLSITRYFGDGKEESDCNADGPNIELDGFGLFLWSLGEYARAGGDLAFVRAAYAVLRDEIADVLASLVGADGVVVPDSSIWEVHWNGKQRKFTYTSLTAARGLCDAAEIATRLGETADAARWLAAGTRVRDAVVRSHTDRRGALAQSAEDLAAGHHYVDAATVEAVNFGVVDPRGRVAAATLRAITENLRVPSGMGFMRNDDGGDYDSHEWVFVDLRLVAALRAAGQTGEANALLAWLEGQALANDLQFAELHQPRTGAYAGSIPMAGFGAGAYLLARSAAAVLPGACGAYAPEPAAPDGGVANDGGVTLDGGVSFDGGATIDGGRASFDGGRATPIPAAGGGCRVGAPGDRGFLVGVFCVLCWLVLRRIGRRAAIIGIPAALFFGACGGDKARGSSDGGADGGANPALRCSVSITYRATGSVPRVYVAGEWNAFAPAQDELVDDGTGTYRIDLSLTPGLYAYKLVVEGDGEPPWRLDPGNTYRAYADGVENSGLRVPDCSRPALRASSAAAQRPSSGAGRFDATLRYDARAAGAIAAVRAELRGPGVMRALSSTEAVIAPGGAAVTVSVFGLADGKYTVRVTAQDASGRDSPPLLLPFWIEAETFSWDDALIYLVMLDRFRDGDPANNRSASGASTGAAFVGGDLQGVAAALREGYFDELGVRALWVTPWVTNPQGNFSDADGVHMVSAFHGYWPIDPRGVDPRFGGEAALDDMIAAAHSKGIRVLMDLVLNHVHEQHPYVSGHADWFNTGCICGTDGCDWTARRLDCLFRPYMPDINWESRAASLQFVDDALYWMERFDLDGFRVDAVKHVADGAVFNLGARVREVFEQGGTKTFLMGETAMGWDPGAGPQSGGNVENYGTIARYIAPTGLSGQLDFVLYYAAALQFLGDTPGRGMAHIDYWTKASLAQYPRGAIMTPYIGSHDTSRFISLAATPDKAGNKWSDLPPEPSTGDPYDRLGAAFGWLLAIPGAPLLYAGDEYGEFGGADPDNRHQTRFGPALSAREAKLLAKVKQLGSARARLVGLRRGGYRTLLANDTQWAIARGVGADLVIAAVNKSGVESTLRVPLAADVAPTTRTFSDALGQSIAVTRAGGTLTFTLPPWGVAYLR